MQNIVGNYIHKFTHERTARHRLLSITLVLALVVASLVYWQLRLTGAALANEYSCGLEEHTHADDCYALTLICGYEEGQEEADGTAHVHTEECYGKCLICTLVEHIHTAECLVDTTADVESADDWEATLPELTGVWAVDVVSVARSQLGYAESSANYVLADDGVTHKGYTRYGEWAGNPYGDWDAMFASFCLHYAQLSTDTFPEATGAYAWSVTLREQGLYVAAAEAEPIPGDLAFFDTDDDGKIDRVGIVDSLDADGETLWVIEGNCEGTVCRNSYSITDAAILGYGTLPKQSEDAADGCTYTYEDDDISVSVVLPADSAVPENAVLTVSALSQSDEDYDSLAEQAQSAVDGEIEQVLLYDISFYAADEEGGEYLPVSDAAVVSLTFLEKTLTQQDSTVSVLHYESSGAEPVVLDEVSLVSDESTEQETLTFQTEGFSVFAVVTVVDASYEQVTSMDALNGNSFVITSSNTSPTFGMTAQVSGTGITKTSINEMRLVSFPQWTFELGSSGGYYIHYGNNYLYMYSSGYLGLGTSNQATEFTVTVSDGKFSIASGSYYINNYSGVNGTVFQGYNVAGDDGNWLYLYAITEATADDDDEVLLTELDGQSYAIVNLNSDNTYALLSTAYPSGGLSGGKVTIVEDSSAGVTYVSGEDITVWKFTATGTSGEYYIYDESSGSYLNITGTGQGGVSTSSSPIAITVTAGTGDYAGQVRLSTASGAVNWFGGSNSSNLVFGGYDGYDKNEYQTLCKLIANPTLFYDLNVGSGYCGSHSLATGLWYHYDDTAGTWVQTQTGSTPTDTPVVQTITGSGDTLTAVYGAGDNGFYTYVYTDRAERAGVTNQLIAAGKSPGKEFRLDGWQSTVDGETYTFAVEAAIDGVDSDGNILITDTSGIQRTLPTGTVLTAVWTEVSDIVMFFVNYGGTVLDVEGDVTGRNQNQFTGIIAIGHVYFGALDVGDDAIFAADANESIRIKFVNEPDLDCEDPQIVIDYVTVHDESVTSNPASDANPSAGYSLYHDAFGINDSILEEYLLQFIRENVNVTIHISTASGSNPTIENENATTDNYTVRWYVLKEQVDGWHIDGVMVAKTSEMAITKTFSGLTEDQVDSILENYQMPLLLGEDRQKYVTITTTDYTSSQNVLTTADGVYEYSGKQGDILSYRWILHTITDELYTLSEEEYELAGYDVATIAVHYYTDDSGEEVYEYAYADTSEDFNQQILGGTSTAFSFNNFYTLTGTGMLAVIKTDESGTTLSGATFTLTKEGDSTPIATGTSNVNGLAFFNDLAEGTYYLQETAAPNGYQLCDTVWKVVVEKYGDNSEYVKVTAYASTGTGTYSDTGTVCYDSGSSTQKMQYLPVVDEVANETVIITKVFTGDLTYAELLEIYNASTASNDYATNPDSTYDRLPYYIEVSNGTETNRLYLQDAVRSQSYFSFTWTLTDIDAGDWTITEYNYFHEDFTDTTVTATVNGGNAGITLGSAASKSASLLATFHDDQSDSVVITNSYSNYFTLSLKKVDSETGEALAGAVFDIYGAFSESTDTTRKITYVDSSTLEEKTLYYIQSITSDENGIATIAGLKLSDDTNVFAYVLDESTAPSGYVASTEVKIITVTIDSSDYSAGVYSVEFPNTKARYDLPVTGGTGTQMFALVGLALCVGAGGVLLRRKGARSAAKKS